MKRNNIYCEILFVFLFAGVFLLISCKKELVQPDVNSSNIRFLTENKKMELLGSQLRKNLQNGVMAYRNGTAALYIFLIGEPVFSKIVPGTLPDSFDLYRPCSAIYAECVTESISADQPVFLKQKNFSEECSLSMSFRLKFSGWPQIQGIRLRSAFPLNWNNLSENLKKDFFQSVLKQMHPREFDCLNTLTYVPVQKEISITETFRICYNPKNRLWSVKEQSYESKRSIAMFRQLKQMKDGFSNQKVQLFYGDRRVPVNGVWCSSAYLDQDAKVKAGLSYDQSYGTWLNVNQKKEFDCMRNDVIALGKGKLSIAEFAEKSKGYSDKRVRQIADRALEDSIFRKLGKIKKKTELAEFTEMIKRLGWTRENHKKFFVKTDEVSARLTAEEQNASAVAQKTAEEEHKKLDLQNKKMTLSNKKKNLANLFADIKFSSDQKKLSAFFAQPEFESSQFPSYAKIKKSAGRLLKTNLTLTDQDAANFMKNEAKHMKEILNGKYQKSDEEIKLIFWNEAVLQYPAPVVGKKIKIELQKGRNTNTVEGIYYGNTSEFVTIGEDRYSLIDMPPQYSGLFSADGLKNLRNGYVHQKMLVYLREKKADENLLKRRLTANSYFKNGVLALKNGTYISVSSRLNQIYELKQEIFELEKLTR